MKRRDFLKYTPLPGALALQAGLPAQAASLMAPVEAEFGGQLFRGGADGKIHVSRDAGKSWALHADFGTQNAVVKLDSDSNAGVNAYIAAGHGRFKLALNKSGQGWTTA